MKKNLTFILSVILLSLATHVHAEKLESSGLTYLDNSFTEVTDTVGWAVTGDGLDLSTNYNWKRYAYSNRYMKCGRSSNFTTSDTYTLTTPDITLTARGADLTFNYVKVSTKSTFIVYVLENGTRHLLLSNLMPTGSTSTWYAAEASLSAYAGQTIQLVFEHTNINGYAYLDDVKVEESPLCPTAKHLALTSLQNTSASFSWDNATSDTYIMLLSSVSQLDPGSVSATEILFQDTITASANGSTGWTYHKANLIEGTQYYLYLKSDCNGSMQGYGAWSKEFSFQTPCSAQSVPYTMDFNALSPGELPSCWISKSSYETQPVVLDPLSDDLVDTTNVFSISNNMNSECMIVLPLFSTDVKDLMMSFNAKTDKENISFQIGLTNDLTDAQNIVTLYSQTITNEWDTYAFFFDNSFTLTGTNYYIVLYISSGQTATSSPFHVYLDDISVDTTPSCLYPIQVSISSILDNACTIAWVDKNTTVIDYTIEYTAEGGTAQAVNTTNNPYTLTGLSSDTEYSIRVRSNCNTIDHSEYSTLHTIHTLKPPIIVTIDDDGIENFEGTINTFTILGSNSSNMWAVGTALSHSPTHSMYISGDFGATYGAQDASNYSYAYSYANVSLPMAGTYNLSFSWKGLSQSDSRSYMNVFLTTPDKDIKLNDEWETSEKGTTLIGNQFTNNNKGDWDHVKYIINVDTAGMYRLVFFRKTSSSSKYIGDYTAVDDVQIKYNICDAPTTLSQTSTSTTSVGLSWHSTASNFTVKAFSTAIDVDSIDVTTKIPAATATSTITTVDVLGLTKASMYYFYVQAQCDTTHSSDWVGPLVVLTDCNNKDLPYSYDFNSDIDGTMPLCWLGTPDKTAVETSPSSSYDIDGTPVIEFEGGSLGYAILPEFNTTIANSVLEFDYIIRRALSSGNIMVGYITNSSDTSTFVWIDTLEASTKTTHALITFTDVDATITGRIVIAEPSGSSHTTNYGGAIDNINVYQKPTCWSITAFGKQTNTQETGFTIHWTPNSLSSSRDFKVEYGPTGFTPGSTNGTIINVTDTFYTISGLVPSTVYDVYVSTDCGNFDGTSISVMGNFKTLIPPADGTNYSCNFEDSTENSLWTIVSTVDKNSWEIGTQSSFEGSKGLYLVNSSGVLGYDTPSDNCWAYRHLHCTAGLYTVTLEYKCQGQTTHDYMNCVIIPEVYLPEAGNKEGISTTSIPEGWFSGDPIKMNLQESWISYTFQFSVVTETTVTLAFHWYDNSSTYGDPASVDNITVSRANCRPAYDIDLSSLSQASAKLMWNSYSYDHFEIVLDTIIHTPEELDTLISATFINRNVDTTSIHITGLQAAKTYYAYVHNNCSDATWANWSEVYPFITPCDVNTLPFTDDFETSEVNSVPQCWTYFTGDNVKVSSTKAFSLDQSLYLETAEASSIKLALPFVNMPLPIENYQLVFYAYRASTSNNADIVIALNSAEEISSTELNSIREEPITIPASKEGLWERIIIPFEHPTDLLTGQPITMGEDQIVFLTIPGPANLYIDAVKIEEIPTCAEPYDVSIDSILDRSIYYSWNGSATDYEIQCISVDKTDTITRTISGDSAIFSGLSPHTAYNIHVRSLCTTTDISAWSQAIHFTTECAIEALPYLEDFSMLSTGDMPECWEVINDGNYDEWTSLKNGTEAYLYLSMGYHYSTYDFTLTTPEIDLSTTTHGTMFFDMKGTDYTATPTSLYVFDETTGLTDTLMTSLLFTNIWTNFEVNIQAYIGHIVRFKFQVQTLKYTEGDIYLDNIGVEDRLYVTPPTGLSVSEPTTNSVVVHIDTDPVATSHNVAIVPENVTFNPLTATITPMSLPDSVIVTGLQPNTFYKTYAQALNGSFESKWIGIARFNTTCTAQTLPLIEDFETSINGVANLPLCWTMSGRVSASRDYPASGQGCVKLSSSAQYITPVITDELNTAEVYFNGYAISGTPIIISVCTDPLDLSTKIAVDTVHILNDNSKTVNVDFTAIPSGYHYVVFENNGTNAAYLDNIVISMYATCRFPETFTIGTIEKGKANILISDNDNSTYDIYYGLSKEVDIQHLTATVSNISDSSWITGLGSNLLYTVFVRKNCGTSQGQWIGPLEFTSVCNAITILDDRPYLEDFSSLTSSTYTMPDCWRAINNSGTSTTPYIEQYYSTSIYDPSCFQVESGHEDSLYLILPEYSNALNTLRWEFEIQPESGSNYTTEDRCIVLGTMSDPSNESTFVSFYHPVLVGMSTSSYHSFNIDLRYMDLPADHHYLAYRISDSDYYIKIKDIEISNNDSCGIPQLSFDNLGGTSVTLDINPAASTTLIDLVISNESGTFMDTIWGLNGSTKSYTLTNLTPGTMYYIKARSYCGETISDWSEPITCILPHEAVTTYPYSCNFEVATENEKWNHLNGGLTNQWIIGNDISGVNEGVSGLYISDNNSTATYDISQYTFTWATRQLHMLPGTYQVSFMAKVGGQTSLDVMRAFIADSKYQLLPCNYNTSDLDDFDNTTMTSTTNHAGFIDLLGEDNYLSASDWAIHSFKVVVTDTLDGQLAFLWKCNSSSGLQPSACIDNIRITYDNCPAPSHVDILKTKSDHVVIRSKDDLEVDTVHLHYACVLRDSTFNAINTIATAFGLSGNTVTLNGLTETTCYDLYIARTCLDGSIGAWSEPMPFKTTQISGTVPYFCGFEPSETESKAWTFYNDDTNAWMIDSMAPLTDSYSMYISDDQVHATYDNSESQYSYAVRTIHFEQGTYEFSFSWKCEGESNSDYIMVALTPDSVVPTGGSNNINGTMLSYDMFPPEGSMAWGKFNLKNSLQTETSSFGIISSCDMNLIFAWKNDGDGSNPGAIIDDINITKQSCAAPFNLHTEALTSISTTLTWINSAISTHLTIKEIGVQNPIADTTITDTFFILNGLNTATTYTCQAYSICSATDTSSMSDLLSFTTPCATYTLPFDETFELNLATPNCWQETTGLANLGGITNSSTLSGTSSSWSHNSSVTAPSHHQKLRLCGTDRKEWLITPLIALEEDATLSFDLALTDYGNWNTPNDDSDAYASDDKFAVLISRDYGTTWQAISSDGHQYFNLPNTFETQMITIPSSADHAPIQLAFYGESTVTNGDNDIHLDNIHLNCMSSDTLVLYDTICQGYAYGRNGFSIPADMVTTTTYTQLVVGDASTCDQMKELHLFVNPRYDLMKNVTICQGQSYPFGTENLTADGEYVKTLSTVNGCDSVVHLTLTVTQLVVNIDTIICEGNFIELGGKQISISGLYSDTTRNAEGCDSVTNINLYVIPTSFMMDSTVCEGDAVTVGSATYTTTGTYIDTLQNVLNCDSIVTLNLTVIPSDTVYSGQFCSNSTYNFNGTVLTTPGFYTDTVHNYMNSGCDYVYKLTLNETLPDTVEIVDQFCEGRSSYNEHGFSINDPEEKDYIVTKTSGVTGCDSITILHLSMVNTVYGSTTQTICDNESFTFGGKDYYVSGTYEHTFVSTETGCDSVVTLTLTVNPTYTVDVSDSVNTEELPYTNLTLVVPEGTEVGNYDYIIASSTQAGCDSIINLTLTITKGDGLHPVNVGTLDFYPNVVKGGGDVTISTDFSASERQGMSIRLYDATGKLIATYQAQSAGTLSCTMPSVSGMYYLRLETKSGKTFSGKLIIL